MTTVPKPDIMVFLDSLYQESKETASSDLIAKCIEQLFTWISIDNFSSINQTLRDAYLPMLPPEIFLAMLRLTSVHRCKFPQWSLYYCACKEELENRQLNVADLLQGIPKPDEIEC